MTLVTRPKTGNQFRVLQSMLQFRGLSVCHIRVHCAQMAEDIDTFLLRITAPCLSQITSKFGLHWSTDPSSPKFAQNDPPSYEFDLSAGDIRWQIVAKWVTMESL